MKEHGLLRKTIIFVQGFLLLNILWLIASLLTDKGIIPSPMEVYIGFGGIIEDGLFLHIGCSLWRILAGVFLALGIGVPAGIFMAVSKAGAKILYPLVYFCYPIPKTALLPLAMLLWGMRDGSKIMIIFLIVVFQVIVAVRDAVINIDKEHYKVLISLGATRTQIAAHVILPAIMPDLLTSLRVSVGTASAVLFFVEGYGTKYGMGYYILNAWSRINYIDMYAGIVVISLVGFMMFAAIDQLFHYLCRWKKSLNL